MSLDEFNYPLFSTKIYIYVELSNTMPTDTKCSVAALPCLNIGRIFISVHRCEYKDFVIDMSFVDQTC